MIKILLLPALLVSLVRAIVKPPIEVDSHLESFLCSPLGVEGKANMLLKVMATRTAFLQVQIKIYNEVFPDGKTIFTEKCTTSNDVLFTYDNSSSLFENEIEVITTNYKNKFFSTNRHKVPFNNPQYVNIQNDRLLDKVACSIYTASNDNWVDLPASYSFEGFDELYIPKFYHKIDFSEFKINIPDIFYSAFSSNAELLIKNYTAKYYDRNDSGGYSSIPLKMVQDKKSYVHFEPSIPLYVNMNTLEMSLEKHTDYVQTKHFYLPVNKYLSQDDYSFAFVFSNFGFNNSSLVHNFKFNALINSIGDCVNSEYCVIRS